MNAITRFLAISATVVGTALHVGAFAQSATDTSKMPTTQMSASMTDGEVKKIDKDAGKITLKHGEIKNLDMPGMTMVFTVKDKSLLDKVQPGDKVKFHAVSGNGKLIVTDIQPIK